MEYGRDLSCPTSKLKRSNKYKAAVLNLQLNRGLLILDAIAQSDQSPFDKRLPIVSVRSWEKGIVVAVIDLQLRSQTSLRSRHEQHGSP